MEYNEDDCRATKALRDWLNGAARDTRPPRRPPVAPRSLISIDPVAPASL